MRRFFLFFLLFLWTNQSLASSPNIPLDSWVYSYIEKLSSLGYIQCYMESNLPLTRMEAASLILEAKELMEGKEGGGIAPYMLRRLSEEFSSEMARLKGEEQPLSYLKPLNTFYLEWVHLSDPMKVERKIDRRYRIPSEFQELEEKISIAEMEMENDSGRRYGKGSNFQVGLIAFGELGSHFSFLVHPEFRERGDDLGSEIELPEASIKLSLGSLELLWGRENLWWGQGRHGSLSLTNNNESLRLLKVSTLPMTLPSVLGYLGAFKLSFFTAELEEEWPSLKSGSYFEEFRYLSGIKFNLKPHPLIEIGASRTFIYDDLSDFFDALTAENKEGIILGIPQGTLDWRVTIPFKYQPITLYGEHGVGDESGDLSSFWAHLGGLYLPRLLWWDRLDLRIEYSNTELPVKLPTRYLPKQYPPYLYRQYLPYLYHFIYHSYPILGHHMGIDAEDLFFNLGCFLTPEIKFGFSFDREKRGLSMPVEEEKKEYTLSLEYFPRKFFRCYSSFQWEEIDNKEFLSGKDEGRNYVKMGIAFSF